MTHSSDETSYCVLTSSGSLSMRTNMVGTTWLWVARYCSMYLRYSSASNRSITTTVAPIAIDDMQKRRGAAWYRGAGERYVLLESMANKIWSIAATPVTRSSIGCAA